MNTIFQFMSFNTTNGIIANLAIEPNIGSNNGADLRLRLREPFGQGFIV